MLKEDIILEAPQSKEKGTLILFHGLTGTPDEMSDIATFFNTKGFRIVLPCLSGHGTSIEELKQVTEDRWLADAERAFKAAQTTTDKKVLTIGQSFGALLSLYLLERYPQEIDSAALLSPPIRFRSELRELLLCLLSPAPECLLGKLGVVKKQKRTNPGFVRPREAYDSHSIAAVVRLYRIRRRLLARLSTLQAHLLVLQDPADHHLSVDAITVLRKHSPLSTIEHRWILGAQHEIAMGPKQAEVLSQLERFLNYRLNSKGKDC